MPISFRHLKQPAGGGHIQTGDTPQVQNHLQRPFIPRRVNLPHHLGGTPKKQRALQLNHDDFRPVRQKQPGFVRRAMGPRPADRTGPDPPDGGLRHRRGEQQQRQGHARQDRGGHSKADRGHHDN